MSFEPEELVNHEVIIQLRDKEEGPCDSLYVGIQLKAVEEEYYAIVPWDRVNWDDISPDSAAEHIPHIEKMLAGLRDLAYGPMYRAIGQDARSVYAQYAPGGAFAPGGCCEPGSPWLELREGLSAWLGPNGQVREMVALDYMREELWDDTGDWSDDIGRAALEEGVRRGQWERC
jgi:hypothetical protein